MKRNFTMRVQRFYWLPCPVHAGSGRVTKRQRAPFQNVNFAHRGPLRDKSVPGELAGGRSNWRPAPVTASSLTMRLSKDGQVVVFHDDDLKRVCGVDCRVDEKHMPSLRSAGLRLIEYTRSALHRGACDSQEAAARSSSS